MTIHNKTDLERMAPIEADGTAHYDTGDVKMYSTEAIFRRHLVEARHWVIL